MTLDAWRRRKFHRVQAEKRERRVRMRRPDEEGSGERLGLLREKSKHFHDSNRGRPPKTKRKEGALSPTAGHVTQWHQCAIHCQ